MEVFGKRISKDYLMKRVGDTSQVAGARLYELAEGKARGCRIVHVKTGSGLAFDIVVDRCMDIAWAEYKGIPIGFISKTDINGPSPDFSYPVNSFAEIGLQ